MLFCSPMVVKSGYLHYYTLPVSSNQSLHSLLTSLGSTCRTTTHWMSFCFFHHSIITRDSYRSAVSEILNSTHPAPTAMPSHHDQILLFDVNINWRILLVAACLCIVLPLHDWLIGWLHEWPSVQVFLIKWKVWIYHIYITNKHHVLWKLYLYDIRFCLALLCNCKPTNIFKTVFKAMPPLYLTGSVNINLSTSACTYNR